MNAQHMAHDPSIEPTLAPPPGTDEIVGAPPPALRTGVRRVFTLGLRGWLAAGAVLGLAYGALNAALDALDRAHALGPIEPLHPVVDRVLPLLLGLCFGLAIHLWLLRERTALAEAARAEALSTQLHRIERDQAVWVVATATLHDVRNPLHALGLLLEELHDEHGGGPIVDRARAQVGRIERSLRALREIANEARPVPRMVPLVPLARGLITDFAALARERGVALEMLPSEPIDARADPTHLRIALENLLRNAIESVAGKGAHVSVALTRDAGTALVRISDDGPGVAPDVRGAMFEPLTTTKEKGLGLGLPIARALARSMGGEVGLVERAGWSTTFELRIPAHA